jgi:P pilus assembly chaperone PapD
MAHSVVAKIFRILILVFFLIQHAWSYFTLKPMRVEFKSNQKQTTIAITNNADVVKFVEVDSYLWTQENEKDIETPNNDFIIFPKTFKLKAGQTKKIQIKPREEAPDEFEKSYRLLFREIRSDKEMNSGGVRVVVNIKCPLYRKPKNPEYFQPIDCQLKENDKQNLIKCINPNKENILLRDIIYLKEGQEDSKSVGLTIQPGKEKSIPLTGPLELIRDHILRIKYAFRGEGKEFKFAEGPVKPQEEVREENPESNNLKLEE